MSDIYKTAFALGLTGNIQQEILGVSRALGVLDKKIVETQGKLHGLSLGKGIFESVAKLKAEFGGVTGSMAVDLRSLKAVSAEVSTAMGREFKGVFSSAESQIGGLNRQLAEMASKMRSMQFGSGSGSGGGRSIRHPGSGVVDTIAMGPQHSGVFAGMNVEHSVVGGLLAANGALQRQINNYRASGASAMNVQAARSAAYRSSVLVPDVGVAEAMKLYRELEGATGDAAGSRALLPEVAKTKSFMSAITGRDSDEDMKRLFKFIELRGIAIDENSHKIDVGKFGSELNYASKATVASQGLITTNDMLQFAKQAGPMAKGMSGDQLFSTMLASMEDMGGSRSGTALSAVGRQFLGGIMTGNKADRLDELHLLNKEGVDRSGAHAAILDPTKGIKGYEVLAKQGFGAFMDQIIRPALQNAGITDRQAQNNELYRSLSTDTARRQVGLFLSGQEQVAMVADRFHKAMGASQGYDEIFGSGQDLQTSTKALHEAFTTLKTALGEAPAVSASMMTLARGVAALADIAKDHPALGATATLGGVGASASLLGFGALQTIKGFGLPAAATQLSAAAVALDAAAVKIGGGSVAADAAKLAGPLAVGALGAGAVAGAAAAAVVGSGALAGATNSPITDDFGRIIGNYGGKDEHKNPAYLAPDSTPSITNWIKGWFTTPEAKGAAEVVGKQSALSVTDGFKTGPFEPAGTAAARAILSGFLNAISSLGGANGVQNASFGGGLGGLISKASLGANDNFGSASGVARALDRGAGGGLVPRGAFGPGTGAGDSWYEATMRAEGTAGKDPYNVVLGNGRYGLPSKPLTDMSLAEAYAFGRTVRARHGSSSALGAFQIVGKTMKGFMGEAGLGWDSKFSPENQRKLADVIRKHQGLGAWEGFKAHPGERAKALYGGRNVPADAAPPPTAGPPPRQHQMVQVHTAIHVDGKKLAQNTSRHMAEMSRFPLKAGGMDTHGEWRAPGTPVTDAA